MPSRAYGWRKDGTLDPIESEVLRGVVDQVLEGKSTRQIVMDLNRRGVKTATGREWAITPLKRMLLHPRMIGMQQDSKGRVSKWRDENRVPLLEREKWERVRAQLAPTAARVASAPKRAREAWLTGIARCGACGGPMTSKGQPERPRGYACREVGPGHVHIDAGIVEDAVLGMMLDRVAEHGAELAPRITFWSTVAGVDEQIRDAERRQNMLASEFAAGGITQAAFEAGTAAASARLDELRARRGEVAESAPMSEMTPVDAARMWQNLTNRARLGFARLLLASVTVHPAAAGKTGADRLDVEWVEPFPLDAVAFAWGGMRGSLPVVA